MVTYASAKNLGGTLQRLYIKINSLNGCLFSFRRASRLTPSFACCTIASVITKKLLKNFLIFLNLFGVSLVCMVNRTESEGKPYES